MKKSVKVLVIITISLCLGSAARSQLKLAAVNGIAPDIKKVIQDYPRQFHNLMGEVIVQNPQSTVYACNFKMKGAEEASITKYSAANQYDIMSWQARLLTTEDFEEAKKKFKSLYKELNNLSVRMEEGVYFQLKGNYEEPVEEKKFTTVVFSVDNGGNKLKKLKVELQMVYEPMEWKVKVLVYDKEREDDERGPRDESR
ncbi:MAG: hypothetical protein J0L56_03765 [Chitinophagales bacterium]|nr:hypothetical protein [Chitinophagales bacterium]